MTKKIFFRWLKLVLLVYALMGIAIYYLQDYIILHPVKLEYGADYSFAQPHKEVHIPYDKKVTINLEQFIPADDTVTKGVVLYFPGNAGNLSNFAPAAPLFTQSNYEVWMMDYPGFGKSTGTFSEQEVYDWALTVYKLARARYAPGQIIIYGRSLGTGVAAQLAAVRNCRHLILEAPYYSLPSVFGSYLPVYPMHQLIEYQFPIYEYLPKVTDPVTIFHGDEDYTIPSRNTRRLKPLLKAGDEFIEVPRAGHNDLTGQPIVRDKITDILRN